MKTILMIKDNAVENITSWNMTAPWDPGSGYILFDITDQPGIEIGDAYNPALKKIIPKNIVLTKQITLQNGLPV